jgi:hypothetical protein
MTVYLVQFCLMEYLLLLFRTFYLSHSCPQSNIASGSELFLATAFSLCVFSRLLWIIPDDTLYNERLLYFLYKDNFFLVFLYFRE